jgi:SAM-dependent methyltransferase
MSAYLLGHTDPELLRLERQGRFLHDLSREVYIRAGVRPGMRVLDFGSGAGDVSLILSELVGPEGRVVGVDRAPEAVERARRRYAALGVRNVEAQLLERGLADVPGAPFDAVACRLVLLHQPDPVATIGALAGLVRPGGLLAFHEIEIGAGHWSSRPLPLFEQSWRWIVDTFTRGGMPTDIGARIAQGFSAAGLEGGRIMREGRVEQGDPLAHEFIARTVRSLLPGILRGGVAAEAEVDIDTLEERLAAEAVGASHIPVFFTAAWARRPG